MITSGLILIVLYLLLLYAFECIKYFNKIDERFGNSLWRWSYDYPVKGKQDISNIDDPEFVALRRRRNTAVTCMYWIFFLGFFGILVDRHIFSIFSGSLMAEKYFSESSFVNISLAPVRLKHFPSSESSFETAESPEGAAMDDIARFEQRINQLILIILYLCFPPKI